MLSECQLQIIECSSFSLDKNKNLIQSRKLKKKKLKKKTPLSNIKTLFKFGDTREPFLISYIESNTELRREAEKEDNKMKRQNSILRNNAVFGKSIETPIKKVDSKTGTTRKQYFKWFYTNI